MSGHGFPRPLTVRQNFLELRPTDPNLSELELLEVWSKDPAARDVVRFSLLLPHNRVRPDFLCVLEPKQHITQTEEQISDSDGLKKVITLLTKLF